MIPAGQRSPHETSTEFEPEASSSSGEQTSVQLRTSEPTGRQLAFVPENGDSNGELWYYKESSGCVHGPYTGAHMASWLASWWFFLSLSVKRVCDQEFQLLGQVIKAWGRLPFLRPLHSTYNGGVEGPRANTLACPADSKIAPPPDSNNLKDKTASCKDLQGRPAEVVVVTTEPPATGQPQPTALSQCVSKGPYKVSLAFRDVVASSENKRSGGNVRAEPLRPEGAWGGYKCPLVARNFTPVASPPAQKVVNRHQPAQPPPVPLTWVKVCQRAMDNTIRDSGSAKQEPVAIENMARLPSLGGRAFTDSMQKKKNQTDWSRRTADDRDFTRWSCDMLRNFPSYTHAPYFLELLKDVESSVEIEEYVRMHLGNSQEALHFAREYTQRRAQWKQQTIGRGSAGATQLRGASVGSGATSKGRKKMLKLNGMALGFSVKGTVFKK